MYAVVENGGKQFKVEEGMTIEIDILGREPGSAIELDKVLLFSDGDKVVVGTPYIDKAKVSGEVLGQIRGKKVISFKKKRRKDYTKKIGHRQNYDQVLIKKIIGG